MAPNPPSRKCRSATLVRPQAPAGRWIRRAVFNGPGASQRGQWHRRERPGREGGTYQTGRTTRRIQNRGVHGHAADQPDPTRVCARSGGCLDELAESRRVERIAEKEHVPHHRPARVPRHVVSTHVDRAPARRRANERFDVPRACSQSGRRRELDADDRCERMLRRRATARVPSRNRHRRTCCQREMQTPEHDPRRAAPSSPDTAPRVAG